MFITAVGVIFLIKPRKKSDFNTCWSCLSFYTSLQKFLNGKSDA